jgi:hypothetical protein
MSIIAVSEFDHKEINGSSLEIAYATEAMAAHKAACFINGSL